jgi:hypothetical protein
MRRGHYKHPPVPELIQSRNSIEELLRKPDPNFSYNEHPRRMNHKERRAKDEYKLRNWLDTDRRSQEQREQDIFGEWYPFVVAMKAEERNARRVAKAQAALKYEKKKEEKAGSR